MNVIGAGNLPIARPRSQGPRILDSIGLGESHPKVDVHLEEPEYKGITQKDASRMLGYFSQTMQNQGFPWRMHQAVPADDGQFEKGPRISDLETLRRLGQGQPVMLQPMRNLQLDLSSDSLGAVATMGALGTGAAQAASLTKLADFSKNTQVSGGSQGIELKYGEPVVVGNYAELKLLYQMYNPDDQVKAKSEVGKAANQLSYFTQKTATGNYPWRFYKESDRNVVSRVASAMVKGGVQGVGVGGGVGALVGAPLALLSRSWHTVLGSAAIGAAGFALYSALQSARTASKGEGINAVEALERLLDGKDVMVQETQLRSVGVPILGKISWFSDHGKANQISSVQDLDTLYWMQNQDAKPEQPKEDEPAPSEPSPQVVIINQSYHEHLGPETNFHEGLEIHQS